MNVSSVLDDMQENLANLLERDHLDALARKHRFIVRPTNRIEAIDFVALMTVEVVKNPHVSLEGLCDLLLQLSPEASLSKQALGQRINTAGAANFLREVFCQSLSQAVNPVLNSAPPELLSPFGRVLLQDSTYLTLNDSLSDAFTGCGRSGAKAGLKLHLVYD